MATGETEVIPIKIEADGSSVDALKAKLREAEADVHRLQQGAKVPTYLEFQTSEAKANVKALTAEVKALERANKDAEKSASAAAKAFAKDQAANAKEQHKSDAEEAEKVKSALEAGGDALKSGGTFVLEAALAIGAAAVGIVAAGVDFGIKQSAQREKQTDILDRLTKGQGDIAYDVAKHLAMDTGTGLDESIKRVKGLIQAKFGRGDTEAIFKASADIGEVKGEAKAELFVKTLEKVELTGKASEKAVKALAGAGVDSGELYAGLQKTGESIDAVKLRLKAGKVSAEDFAHAATAAVQKDIGGIAGKGQEAQLNRLKIGFASLFDEFNLGPLDDVGTKLNEVLGGAEGKELKKAITEAGNAVIDLLKNVSKDDIKLAFISGAEGARELAKAIKTVSEAVSDLAQYSPVLQYLRGGGIGERQKGGGPRLIEDQATGNVTERKEVVPLGDTGNMIGGMTLDGERAEKGKADAAKEGVDTGKAYADGMAKGIEDNAHKPAAAAAGMVGGTVAAGNAAQKSHSPSEVMAESGKNYDEGYAGGIRGHAGKPEAAATAMVERTTRAGGGGGAGGLANGSGIGGGGDINISIVQQLPPGSSEATKEAAREGIAMMMPILLAKLREAQRLGGAFGPGVRS